MTSGYSLYFFETLKGISIKVLSLQYKRDHVKDLKINNVTMRETISPSYGYIGFENGIKVLLLY